MENIFNEERQYLEHVKKSLKENIEYQKQEMKEIPKRHTNVLQGDSFLVESLMSIAASKLYQLENAQDSPYFGRIDFLADDSNQCAKLYLGKTAIKDETGEFVTIDWRAPICSLYYDSDVGRVSYEAPKGEITGELKLKRQIIIEKGELLDVKDTSIVAQDDVLQHYLNIHADDKMKNIVASIQKEQYKIIKLPLYTNVVVQGVAGSGKTSVALHRIAYLVYNESKNIQESQFLVIGPNKYFLDYISGLLPDLDVSHISQTTFYEIAEDIIGEKIKVSDQNLAIEESIKTGKINKSLSLKSSLKYRDALDKFMQDYIAVHLSKDIKIGDYVLISSEEIKESYSQNFTGNINTTILKIQNGRIQKIKGNYENIYSKITASLLLKLKEYPIGSPERQAVIDEMNIIQKEVKTGCSKTIKSYFKSLLQKPSQIYKEFISNAERYLTGTEEELKELKERTIKNLSKKTVEYEDLAALMYIKLLMDGNTKYQNYKQLVLDEAQDFGIFHFDILRKVFKGANFSIFGDLNQAIYTYRSINNWNLLNKEVFNNSCVLTTLDKSYRTTDEIMREANKIPKQLNLHVSKSLVRHGEEVEYMNTEKLDEISLIVDIIQSYLVKGYKTIAIISKSDLESQNLFKKLQASGVAINYISSKDETYKGGICCVTSYLSKGLEFDATILTNVSKNNYLSNNSLDQHLLYVAMTRALHESKILFNKELTDILNVEHDISLKLKR